MNQKPAAAGWQFFSYVQDILKEVQETQSEAIEKAARLIADAHLAGKEFYVFGSGHSHIMAEEIYARAGGLAFVRAILPTELMVLEFPTKSTGIERLTGYAAGLIEQYEVGQGDVILIISNSGRNAVPVEMAMEARKAGAKVIALTSMAHSSGCCSRHPSGKKLYELADVVIDNKAPAGDAAFPIEGTDVLSGPVSDITGCAIMDALVCDIAQVLQEKGEHPEIFKSSNADGGDEYNAAMFKKYYGYRRT